MDFSGTYTYSEVIALEVSTLEAAQKIYPNPFHDVLTIETNDHSPVRITLLDASGRIIMDVQADETFFELNTTGISAGAYLLRIEQNDKVDHIRVIRTN